MLFLGYVIIQPQKHNSKILKGGSVMPRWSNEDRTPLAAIRANSGLTRTQAAVLLDVALNTLGRYESGYEIPLDVVEDMATLYNVSFEDIRNACAAIRKPSKRKPLLENINFRKRLAIS